MSTRPRHSSRLRSLFATVRMPQVYATAADLPRLHRPLGRRTTGALCGAHQRGSVPRQPLPAGSILHRASFCISVSLRCACFAEYIGYSAQSVNNYTLPHTFRTHSRKLGLHDGIVMPVRAATCTGSYAQVGLGHHTFSLVGKGGNEQRIVLSTACEWQTRCAMRRRLLPSLCGCLSRRVADRCQ